MLVSFAFTMHASSPFLAGNPTLTALWGYQFVTAIAMYVKS
jgi:hypothetical protein